jgi:glycosyltransferase involved in cell wall biosynthesis
MTLVSVVMAARDARAYVCEAIDSVRAQTTDDWELIVVDDASTDDTPAIVERYGATDARIRLVRRASSGGPYVAANEGLAHVQGSYVARLDSDDVCKPDRFVRQVRYIEERPDVRACTSNIAVLKDGVVRPFRVREVPTLPGSIKWGLSTRGFLQSTAMVETAALRELGGYRELPVSQDHRLWCDLSRRGWLGSVPDALVQWRVHATQISETRLELQQRLGAEAVRDHLHELGEEWSYDDVHALRSIGQRPVAQRRGSILIRRFERAWSSDASLTPDERAELRRLTRRLRVEHEREVFRAGLGNVSAGRALLRAYTRMHVRAR